MLLHWKNENENENKMKMKIRLLGKKMEHTKKMKFETNYFVV